jgi:hypothetical protein
MKHVLITQLIFSQTKRGNITLINHNNIINFGTIDENNIITYITREGTVKIPRTTVAKDSIYVFDVDQVCWDKIMSNWKKFNNFFKPVKIDMSIDTLEVHKIKFSPLEIMVKREKDFILIKPLF